MDSKVQRLSLNDFNDVGSIELNRLLNMTRKAVERIVKAEERDGKPCITVPGSFPGHICRKDCLPIANVLLVIVLETMQQSDA